MNRLNLTIIVLGLLTLAACKKGIKTEDASLPAGTTAKAVEECVPNMYSLTVDSVTGASYIFKVSGSPSAGPITVAPYAVGGGTNQLLIGGTTPILRASGLSYDPTTGIFYGTTGITGSIPNAIFKFTNPNFVSIIPTVNTCGLVLDLSDVERDQTTGVYYAINRGTVAPNNTIVKLGLPVNGNITCLPNPLPVSLKARGLTFNCNGMLYVMHTNWANGTIVFVDKITGATGAAYAYPGPITSAPAVPIPDLGLHFDCACIGRFITASFNRITAPLVTDGLPGGLGGPVYNGVVGFLKPTVDFARP
ncbi:hypothetical protein [Niastella sp. OAS944]|uniref:hypothetical protein n=1 Tax=Niastella sp. OAS944 TaxID=2664089 RepID=UPI0034835AD0|nr:hypothetical protein [Chitinophagaceae bacterium OAS944]